MWVEPILAPILTGDIGKIQTAMGSWAFLEDFVAFMGITEPVYYGRIGLATRALLTTEMAELMALGMTLGVLHA